MAKTRVYVYRVDTKNKTWYMYDMFPHSFAVSQGIITGELYGRKLKDGHTYLLSQENNVDWSFRF